MGERGGKRKATLIRKREKEKRGNPNLTHAWLEKSSSLPPKLPGSPSHRGRRKKKFEEKKKG